MTKLKLVFKSNSYVKFTVELVVDGTEKETEVKTDQQQKYKCPYRPFWLGRRQDTFLGSKNGLNL